MAIYVIIKYRLKVIQKAFNLLKVTQRSPPYQSYNDSFQICIGRIEQYECGYNKSCVGNINSNSDHFIFFPEDIEHLFLKYFAKIIKFFAKKKTKNMGFLTKFGTIKCGFVKPQSVDFSMF